ncbi:MAG: TCP-1/cpn60 chaperonin family protein, partial [Nitrososphaerales archaeon]
MPQNSPENVAKLPPSRQSPASSSGMELSSLASNVMSAMALADTIRSTLGPRGLDKLLVDQLGNRVITNDGYTVLVSLKTTNPVNRLLVEISERQQFSVGDGTTSAVIMAAEMLREGYRIIAEFKVHPTKLIGQIDEALGLSKDYLKNSSIQVGSFGDPLLRQVINTATASKLDGRELSDL